MANPSKFGMQTVMGGIQITPASPGGAGGVGPGGGPGMSAADFDRFAAQIRPIWEFDDAPFAATAAINAVDLAALQGGGGANAEVAAALMNGGAPDVLSSDLLVTEPVLPFAAPSSQPMAAPVAQPVVRAPQPFVQPVANGVSHHSSHPAPSFAQQQQALPTTRPRGPQPSASSYLDDDLPIKKSKTPLIVGVVVALAVVGTIIGGLVGLSGPSTTATPDKPAATTPMMTAAPKDIPPPPPVADIPAPPEPTTPPVAVAAPAAPAAPPHVATLPPLPPATHAQTAPPKPPAHTIPPALRPPPAAAKPPPKAGGGIVRDNPF